ncbi:MAG: BNR-4 repeat-containing protein, partial [Clostridia bacterium]|nr:BNR-4 repeat-containing protein [Clostridia bacterium]
DVNDTEIAFLKLDKNAPTPGDSHPDAGNDEIYALGFPSNYTPVAMVVYNNGDNSTHTVDYYVNGEKVYTQDSLAGTISGFKSIQGHNGWWSNWSHIGFADLTISTVINSETTVEVSAVYTAGDRTVKTETKRYDSTKADSVTFPAFTYSANGENTLYTANAVTLSESDTVTMDAVANVGEYESGGVVAYEGTQYDVLTENLVPNSDFAYGLAGWYACSGNAATETNFTVNDGSVTIKNGGGSASDAALYRAWDVEVGKTYFLTFNTDTASEWARVTEDDIIAYAEDSTTINVLKGTNTVVKGKNNLVFTATREYVRVNFAWCEGVTVSDFGLYEITEAEAVIDEDIKKVAPLADVVALEDDVVVLPSTVQVEGTLGSLVEGAIIWDEPESYTLGETALVEGEVSALFASNSAAIKYPVTISVTVYPYDHEVQTFWHAGDDSNSANFGMYNYLGNYNGGVIIADTQFKIKSGSNQLIMYGNGASNAFGNTGALVRMMQAGASTPFEYYDGSWKQSAVVPAYSTTYTLRTTIDVTNKTYELKISANGGEWESITPGKCAFRNASLESIDRMIYSGALTMISHKTAWISGFSYVNVEYVDENGISIRDGYKAKTATGIDYYDYSAPKLIESGDALYILSDVDSTPFTSVPEGESTFTITYNEVEMVEFESPYVNHVRGDSAINLPSQVKMVFSDGQKILYNVSWDTSEVDTEQLGEYEAVGTIDGIEMKASATVNVRDLEILPKTTENTVVTNNGGWNWYVEPSGTHIQPGDSLATRYESGQYSSNNGYTFQHDKTYMGWVEDEGTIVVGEYDHDTDTYKRVVIHEFLEADDHNNPAVVVLPDGRIMVFYSKHTTEDRMYYCVSKNPEDISEWNDWQYYHCYTAVENSTYNATYPSVFIVHDDEGIEGNDVIYVGWRGVHWKPTLAKFSIPDENGKIETIMGQTQFANTSYWSYDDGGRSDGGRRPYTKYDYDFDRSKIYITFTANHPDNDVNNHIYYVTLDITDQNLYTAKGNLLQPLPKENSADYVSKGANGTNGQWGIITNQLVGAYPELLVFDANAQITDGGERRGWTWDIKVNEAGEPCIVYVDVTATAPGPNGELPTWYGPNVNDSHRSHHYYWYARWDTDTQTWVKTFLSYAGKWWHENATQERCYSGGLTFDHNAPDANVIYLSIPTMGEHGNIFEIYRWESDDHGATWTVREPITQNSTIN